jgi:hypothetical protein
LEEPKSNRLSKGKVKFLTIMKATSATIGREKDRDETVLIPEYL